MYWASVILTARICKPSVARFAGPSTRKLNGDRFPQSIGRPGNQDDLVSQWSHLVLPVSRITLRSEAKLEPPLISCPGFGTVRSVPGPSSRPPASCLPRGRRRAAESAVHTLVLPRLSPP